MIEIGGDVRVDDGAVAQFVALADAGDSAVHRSSRSVSIAALQKLLFERPRHLSGDGRLQDAVGHRGDQQRSRVAGFLLHYDAEQRVRPVVARPEPLKQVLDAGCSVPRELVDREAVRPRAPRVLLHALPSLPKLFGGDAESHFTDTRLPATIPSVTGYSRPESIATNEHE